MPSVTGDTLALITDFLERIRKRCLLLSEQSGFILNRIFLDVQNEACRLVDEGVCSFAQMDELVRKNLFLSGIFGFTDSVGLDTMLQAVRNYIRDYPNRSNYLTFLNRLDQLVGEGKLGMKSGEGFYVYPVKETFITGPDNAQDIADYLHQVYLSSVRRFTLRSKLTLEEMNDAVKEYFDLEKGPFEQ
jgi:3-hydroxyacyl-CoA dehydrogenase